MVRSNLIIAGSNFIFSHINENYSKYLKPEKKFLVIFRGINTDYYDPKKIKEQDKKKLFYFLLGLQLGKVMKFF